MYPFATFALEVGRFQLLENRDSGSLGGLIDKGWNLSRFVSTFVSTVLGLAMSFHAGRIRAGTRSRHAVSGRQVAPKNMMMRPE